MCLYVEHKRQAISGKEIKGFKLIIKKSDENFYPYFTEEIPIQFNTILQNNSPIKVKDTTEHWPHNRYVESGVFHIFISWYPIEDFYYRNTSEGNNLDNVYVCEAIIPKGVSYFIGFSHSVTGDIEETFGSAKIIYKNPIPIAKFIKLGQINLRGSC